MDEIWIDIPLKDMNRSNIAMIAISNLGNMKRRNGIIEPIPLRQSIGCILTEETKRKVSEGLKRYYANRLQSL